MTSGNTGSFPIGLLTIVMGSVITGMVVLAIGHDRRLEQAVPIPAE